MSLQMRSLVVPGGHVSLAENVCYRDERGRKIFGVISRFRERDKRVQSYEVELELTEVAHDEGVD